MIMQWVSSPKKEEMARWGKINLHRIFKETEDSHDIFLKILSRKTADATKTT